MITVAEAGKFGAVHTAGPGVLSLYLGIPLDPAELRGLPARADDLIAAAGSAAGGCGRVADQDARLFRIAGEETETVTAPVAASVRGTGFGGWYGLETYRVQQRAARLARHHCRDTAVLLAKAMAHGEPEPLVIGGHHEGIRQLFASLPPGVQELFAGSFAADARTLTPARVRELAAPLVARWAGQHADHLAEEVLAMPPGLATTGLPACLDAVNACAVQTLVVPDDGLVPGYECGRCGALSVAADGCPDWGTAALPVPDVIEEMVIRTLEDGGQVCPVHVGLSRIAARLRFPVAQ